MLFSGYKVQMNECVFGCNEKNETKFENSIDTNYKMKLFKKNEQILFTGHKDKRLSGCATKLKNYFISSFFFVINIRFHTCRIPQKISTKYSTN